MGHRLGTALGLALFESVSGESPGDGLKKTGEG